MTSARIIKVDDIELGLDLISILMVHHVVVGNRRKVGKLEIIDIHRVTLLYLLFDVVVDHSKGLTATWCT